MVEKMRNQIARKNQLEVELQKAKQSVRYKYLSTSIPFDVSNITSD